MDVGDVQGESGAPLARTQDAGAPGAVRQGRGRSQRCHLAVLVALPFWYAFKQLAEPDPE